MVQTGRRPHDSPDSMRCWAMACDSKIGKPRSSRGGGLCVVPALSVMIIGAIADSPADQRKQKQHKKNIHCQPLLLGQSVDAYSILFN